MLQRIAQLLAVWTLGRWVRFWYYAFLRRVMCPRGHHGNHWHYFGHRTRVCRVCHREEWYYPHGGWMTPPNKWAESKSAASGHDEPTDGS